MLRSLICIILLFLVSCSEEKYPDPQIDQPDKDPSQPVVESIESKDSKLLVKFNQLQLEQKPVSEMYKSMFKSEGIRESFLTRKSFNKGDLYYFKQVLVLNSTASSLVKGKEKSSHIRELFNFIRKNIKSPPKDKEDRSAFPLGILQGGYGACDRQSWLLSDLAYQIGADAYLIYLRNPETGVSHHTICEIAYNSKNYIIDPLYGKFVENRTLSELTDLEISKVWNDHPDLHKDFKKAEVYCPSMPHDYTPRFAALGTYFSSQNSPFRIGEDPVARAKRRGKIKGEKFLFWDYPVRALKFFKYYNESK